MNPSANAAQTNRRLNAGATGPARRFREIPDESAQQLLERAVAHFGRDIALSSSFSMEDNVILHMLLQINKDARILALDTGRLNEETYECAERIRRRYGCEIEWFFPDKDAVENLVNSKGLFSFKESVENRIECCFIRKVEPLNRALTGLRAWITGQRREQSLTRASIKAVERDQTHGGIVKLNPLCAWSMDDVKKYVHQNNIPYNRLYDLGYESIGCAPCTRAIKPGEHERAGRWWWENSEHKECGLHLVDTQAPKPSEE